MVIFKPPFSGPSLQLASVAVRLGMLPQDGPSHVDRWSVETDGLLILRILRAVTRRFLGVSGGYHDRGGRPLSQAFFHQPGYELFLAPGALRGVAGQSWPESGSCGIGA